jgi:cation-transporting P-type ATPase I
MPSSVDVVHTLPGRVRLHLGAWDGSAPGVLERKLAALPGVRRASVSPSTCNVLVHYEMARTDVPQLRAAATGILSQRIPRAVRAIDRKSGSLSEAAPGQRKRMRIPLPGVEVDAALARKVLNALRRAPSVIASVSSLTARVLVEYDPGVVAPEELLAAVAAAAPAAARRRELVPHPLERTPVGHSATRLLGGLAGLSYLILAELFGLPAPHRRAIQASALASILQGSPFVRQAFQRWFGHHTGDAMLAFPTLFVRVVARSPLGLANIAADALRVLSDTRTVQAGWRWHERLLEAQPPAEPGELLHLEAGQRCPLPATIVDGVAMVLDEAARVRPSRPGSRLRGGTLVLGGAVTVRLEPLERFPLPRTGRHSTNRWPDSAVRWLGILSLIYATAVGWKRRSVAWANRALLLVNARAAMVGSDAAETGARARIVRHRGTFVGSRPERKLRRPALLVLGSARLLTDGVEIAAVYPATSKLDEARLLGLAAAVSTAAGAPWGDLFRGVPHGAAEQGALDRRGGVATVGGHRYRLRLAAPGDRIPSQIRTAIRRRHPGQPALVVSAERSRRVLGILVLRPRVAPTLDILRRACDHAGTSLAVVADSKQAEAMEVAARTGVQVLPEADVVGDVCASHTPPGPIAFASDSPHAGPGFAECDLAIGIVGPATQFPARADLLAPDLAALASIVDTLARRDAAVRDAVAIAGISDAAGAAWAARARTELTLGQAGTPTGIATLLALAWSRYRLRGENPGWRAPVPVTDPRPEQWGRRDVATVLAHFRTSAHGLSQAEANARRVTELSQEERHPVLQVLAAEARSPLIMLLAAGGLLALLIGSPGDVVVILITLGVNVMLGAWQNHRSNRLSATLEHVRDPIGRVRRDGRVVEVATAELVPGDILVLASGDRVAADARLISADGLELDESALTGESFPVMKSADSGANGGAIVLAGTDVTVGTGVAVIVAVGRQSRMGAMAAVLAHEETASALGARLALLVHAVVPSVVAGGVLVFVAGVLWGQPIVPQFALGLSIALAAFPEGLPLMAAVGQAAAARRLMRRSAFVRRTSAIEALGRVDVACVDKTGTLTEGRLAVRIVSDFDADVELPAPLPPSLARVLLTAARASPHPDASDHAAHPTDAATIRAARQAGFGDLLRVPHEAEARFNSARGFHGSVVNGRVVVKGAFEIVLSRCTMVYRGNAVVPLDAAEQHRILGHAQALAARGLRVLLVADGPGDNPPDEPRNLRALGIVALSDPLRSSVPAAVRRCQEAGIRVVMLTGDHPLTARAIGYEAGLAGPDGELLNAAELGELSNGELERRLDRVTLIARATPLDKLRIVAALQRRGHTVAMTGDGINDAPALRLADVGVAMGLTGTEVARQAADLVLGDDDFTTLVEALVEGRGFWHNIRRALGLLLGGNLGELAVVTVAAVAGRAVPLTVRQILATNLITDALPALAIATQDPEHRRLAALAREGMLALDRPLRMDIVVRAVATAIPTAGAYLASLRRGITPARGVAFASVTTSQLAQTVLAGRAEGAVVRPVAYAVGASGGAVALIFGLPAFRGFFQLVVPSLGDWLLIAGTCVAAPIVNRALRAALNHRSSTARDALTTSVAIVPAA